MSTDPKQDSLAGLEGQKTGAALLAEAYVDKAALFAESDEARRRRIDIELGLLKAILSDVPLAICRHRRSRSEAKSSDGPGKFTSSGPREFQMQEELRMLRSHYAELLAEHAILKARSSAGGQSS